VKYSSRPKKSFDGGGSIRTGVYAANQVLERHRGRR